MSILVAGLGNPGPRYAKTRHNAGFWFADSLATFMASKWKPLLTGAYVYSRASKSTEHNIICVKPLGYMNNSGLVFPALFRRFQPELTIVATDNLDLGPGRIRLKRSSTEGGGHNGLASIRKSIGSDFLVLHLGIGRDFEIGGQIDYVLAEPAAAEARSIHAAISFAAQAFVTHFTGNFEPSAKLSVDALIAVINRYRGAEQPDL